MLADAPKVMNVLYIAEMELEPLRNRYKSVPKRLALCGTAIQWAICLVLWAGSITAAPALVPLPASFRNTTAPPGGTAQLQLFLDSPKLLTGASATLDLDPAVFGDIIAADAYSATGDQVGVANIQGRHVDLEFTSTLGGLGRLPALPVLTITVPVLATALVGTVSPLALKAGTTIWTDVQGYQYSVIATGNFSVGGDVSIRNVQLSGGIQPAGTTLAVEGTGFTNSTTVAIDGVVLQSVNFRSPENIDVTLATAADLTFRRIVFQNGTSTPASFYPVLHGPYAERPSTLVTIQPIFPLALYMQGGFGSFFNFSGPEAVALQNPTTNPVNIIFRVSTFSGSGVSVSSTAITLAPGTTFVKLGGELGAGQARSSLSVYASLPIRMAAITSMNASSPSVIPPLTTTLGIGQDDAPSPDLSWVSVVESSPPAPKTLTVISYGSAVPFTVTVQTESGGAWLSASPLQGTACYSPIANSANSCNPRSPVTVRVDPSSLAPGTYKGLVTLLPQGTNPQPSVVPVSLVVYAKPQIFVSYLQDLDATWGYPVPLVEHLQVTGSSDNVSFTATATTNSGLPWLTVTPLQPQTPALLTVTLDPAVLGIGSDKGLITLHGPNNVITVPVSFTTFAIGPPAVNAGPPLIFTSVKGLPNPDSKVVIVSIINVFSTSPSKEVFTSTVTTETGGNWLSVTPDNGADEPYFNVRAIANGLAPGTYIGTVTFTSSSGYTPAHLPVTLTIVDKLPPIMVTPAALAFTVTRRKNSDPQTIQIATGSLPLELEIFAIADDGASWEVIKSPTFPVGTGTVQISISADSLPGTYTGTYTGSLVIRSLLDPTDTSRIPLTLTVAAEVVPLPIPNPNSPPLVTGVFNAASQLLQSIAPGEIVTVYGQNIGTQLLFDGVPAQVLYSSSTQINAVVPDSVTGPSSVITVSSGTATLQAGEYPTTVAAPGIFTFDGSGEGAANAVNEDGTPNSANNPAPRGSIVQLFATAGGVNPYPASVSLGGLQSRTTFGALPNGLLQLNTEIPQGVTPGSAVPIQFEIGGQRSQPKVTVSVK